MHKYLALIRANWQRALTYRSTILGYRVGEIAEMLFILVLWSSVYSASGETALRGFTLQEMITYFLIGNLFNMVVRSFASERIANDIKHGRLSTYLVRPISYLAANLMRSFASLATLMSVATQLIVITLFFLPVIIFNTDLLYLGVIALMAVFAFMIEFMISYLVGLIAFWTDETDGIYSSIDRIKRIFSGGLFPISFLPEVFAQTQSLLPSGYSLFVPAQLYLKKMDISMGIYGIFVQAVWIAILYGVTMFVWNRGLKRYESVGI